MCIVSESGPSNALHPYRMPTLPAAVSLLDLRNFTTPVQRLTVPRDSTSPFFNWKCFPGTTVAHLEHVVGVPAVGVWEGIQTHHIGVRCPQCNTRCVALWAPCGPTPGSRGVTCRLPRCRHPADPSAGLNAVFTAGPGGVNVFDLSSPTALSPLQVCPTRHPSALAKVDP